MATVIIPARYDSTRLPGKPLVKINGVTMINRVASRCLLSKADRVIVVTDDVRILEECEKIDGLECVMSDKNIKTGSDRVAKVAKYIDDDIIINVQGDEPFIDPKLINDLIDSMVANSDINMITACCEIAEEEASDPNVVKVVVDKNNDALYFSRQMIPFVRDDNKIMYKKHIGIYGFRKNYLFKFTEMGEGELEKCEKLEQLRVLENGDKIRVLMTDYKPVCVDTMEDVKKAEEIAKEIDNG
ncbi:3-deoxy-D-manno-octulosonate cytidylyltransferase [Deferribacter desulfuricans SSM1]|uniref:3-deoxy-manno-octulosonate cytidylyltransferase n=1 Tax=Deferribacter desulfuricans (strain DSM 14783 / JCM 11476 / NBRC 101012 / SSM1) TaxID=639282 RepID=D3PD33_DEFDS|nr:3-deoxy-manno-octulosonate cytidylyltransferase [Deferribacter desulfuricans]BAI80506.1 3-deoxy-D-manno-octulosonate cytidylyltransferase [Deferribacter desulfuricans SSM1]